MRFSLLPKAMTGALTDLTPAYLQNKGIRLLMLDFDNTILPYTTSIPDEKTEQWIQMVKASGIALCVVSNSRKMRARDFCRLRGIGCIRNARKPFSGGICACLEKYNVASKEAALVGDQIFTDILGANCAGVHSILVKPINNHNFWLKLRHILEKPFIFFAGNRRINR